MADTVSWNLQLRVKEGRLDDLRALMREMVASTEAEAGTLAYEWFLSDDGSACHICERYTDSSAAMEHLGNFGAKFAERFLDCLEPTSLHVYGAPSAEARAALDGFGAAYLGSFGGFSRA
jgi:quinol monooxygenase YgiN